MSKQSKILELANQIISLISSHNTDTLAHTNLFNNKEDKTNKVTALSGPLTHEQYPSALATYNKINALETQIINIINGTGEE
jgi:hypothetical protein